MTDGKAGSNGVYWSSEMLATGEPNFRREVTPALQIVADGLEFPEGPVVPFGLRLLIAAAHVACTSSPETWLA